MEGKGINGRLLWFGVLVWFSANLLSQSLYMGANGVPYDAAMVLDGLGPLYLPLLLLEALAWIVGGGWLIKHGLRRRSPFETPSSALNHAVD